MFESIGEDLSKIGHLTFSTAPNTPTIFECNWEDLVRYFIKARHDIEKNYMQLPRDYDGIPIAIGDRMQRFDAVVEVVAVGENTFLAEGYSASFPAEDWYHKKEGQTEKILRSFVKDIRKSNSTTDDLIDKYKEIIEKNERKKELTKAFVEHKA